MKRSVPFAGSSASEIYEMVLTRPTSTNRLRAPDYGKFATKTFRVKTGASYTITVNHAGSSRTDREYHYTAQVTYDTPPPSSSTIPKAFSA